MTTADHDRLRARTWAAHPELRAIGASGVARGRAVVRFGPVVGADLGVPHAWGVQVSAGDVVPDGADARSALDWCRVRGASTGWCASVPAALADVGPWRGLTVRDELPVYATTAATAAALEATPPAAVELDSEPPRADVVAAYGAWMADVPLAELLVTPEDLARPDRRFLVARLDGVPVGCAFVWWARGTGYLSGLGVQESHRGRGLGRLLTAAASRLAAQGPGEVPPDIVWMHATDAGAALYARMGFERIDTELALTDP